MAHTRRPIAFSTNSPDHFAETISPVAGGGISVHPRKSTFRTDVKMARLPRLGLFTIRIDNTRVLGASPRDYYGVTVPLQAPVEVVCRGRAREFRAGWAHVLNWNDEFDLRTSPNSPMLVANLMTPLVQSCGRKLGGGREEGKLSLPERIDLATPEGSSFYRYLSFIWAELSLGGVFLKSPVATREIENTLLELFVIATDRGRLMRCERPEGTFSLNLSRAEDYIDAHLSEPLSIAGIAEAAGTSGRTLSRMFKKRHGMSTKAFIKRRRLESVHRALLAADPGTTTVSEIALEHGFFELGRFSVEYKKAFQESPSETLRHR